MKEKTLLYIKEKDFVATACYIDRCKNIYSIKTFINNLAKRHLFNLEEYYKLARKKIELKNKIPIYYSNELLLFKINSFEGCYYLNYFEILCVAENLDKMVIIFKNFNILNLSVKKCIFLKELAKIEKVLNYISSL